MIVTENEALKMRCCGTPAVVGALMLHALMDDAAKMSPEQHAQLAQGENCRGSKCMAWRWAEPLPDPGPPKVRDGKVEFDGPQRRGYCGLCPK